MSLVTAQIQHYQTQLHQYEQKYAELQVTAIWHFLALFVNLIFVVQCLYSTWVFHTYFWLSWASQKQIFGNFSSRSMLCLCVSDVKTMAA